MVRNPGVEAPRRWRRICAVRSAGWEAQEDEDGDVVFLTSTVEHVVDEMVAEVVGCAGGFGQGGGQLGEPVV